MELARGICTRNFGVQKYPACTHLAHGADPSYNNIFRQVHCFTGKRGLIAESVLKRGLRLWRSARLTAGLW